MASPMASEAVAAGLGAFRTCKARRRFTKQKSCTNWPSGDIACARTPAPPVSRSSARISGPQPLERLEKRAFAERPAKSPPAHPFVFGKKPPQAGEGHRIEQIHGVEVRLFVAFAGEGQHRIRSGLDAAANE